MYKTLITMSQFTRITTTSSNESFKNVGTNFLSGKKNNLQVTYAARETVTVAINIL